MTQPRFQFTIAGMLWATFWIAVSAGGWVMAAKHNISLGVGLLIVCPFIALGALLGQTYWGMFVGVGALALLMVLAAFM
ncbi:MAG: hypothetical protein K8T91_06180 [Planctomycetes bacterium]|nr:hypothetical protein [Planctomycetota bacterium]